MNPDLIKIQCEKYKNSFYDYSDKEVVNSAEVEAEKEYKSFLEKLKVFKKSYSITEAKNKFKEIFPITQEKTFLKIGNAKCVIISRADVFRICIDSEKEYICYNFINKRENK